jgi:hypothetical protein
MKQSMLFAPDHVSYKQISSRLHRPFVQQQAVKEVLNGKGILKLAERRNITVSRDDIREALQSKENLRQWIPHLGNPKKKLPERLRQLGLSSDDVRQIGRRLALRKKLSRNLVEDLTDKQLWKLYYREHFTIELLTASKTNTPGSSQIDSFVRNNPERIETYFKENRKSFAPPPRVIATLLVPPSKSGSTNILEKAKKQLLSGRSPAEVADALDLQLREDVQIYRGQNPDIFSASSGDIGITKGAIRGSYVWIASKLVNQKPPELNDSIRREIASQMIQDEGLSLSVKQTLETVSKKMEQAGPLSDDGKLDEDELEGLMDELQQYPRVQIQRSGTIRKQDDGRVGQLGLRENVFAQAFKLTPSEPVVDEPVLDRQKGWMFRLIAYDEPNRSEFEDAKKKYRADIKKNRAEKILRQTLATWRENNGATIDLAPLRKKYPPSGKKVKGGKEGK